MLNNQAGFAAIASVAVVMAVVGGAVGLPVAVDSVADSKPSSPLYALEKAGESIKGTVLGRDQNWYLDRAKERVQEFESEASRGDAQKYKGVLEEAGEKLSKGIRKTADVNGLERASQAIRRNIQVLENVKDRVPDEAKPAIERAITRSKMQVKALTQTKRRVENGRIPPGKLKEELENKERDIETLVDILGEKSLPPGILKEVLEDREISLENLKSIVEDRDLTPGILKEILSDLDVSREDLEEFLEGRNLPPGIRKEILGDDDIENEDEEDEYENDEDSWDEPENDEDEEGTGEGEPESFVHERGEVPDWVSGNPPWAGEDNEDEEMEEDGSYELLDEGVEMSSIPAAYKVNPSVGENLDGDNVIREIREAFETWDSYTSTELFENDVTVTGKSGFERDGDNVVSFAPLEESEEVALTKIWYKDGRVLEFDIVLNSEVAWGIDPDGEGPISIDSYDIRNIATHEAGHSLVLQDLDEEDYAHLTMYYQSEVGSTNKISLETGDINGLQAIYGE